MAGLGLGTIVAFLSWPEVNDVKKANLQARPGLQSKEDGVIESGHDVGKMSQEVDTQNHEKL